jgi:hypothetical protein
MWCFWYPSRCVRRIPRSLRGHGGSDSVSQDIPNFPRQRLLCICAVIDVQGARAADEDVQKAWGSENAVADAAFV